MATPPNIPPGWKASPAYRNDPTKRDYTYTGNNGIKVVVTIKNNVIVKTEAYKGNDPIYTKIGTATTRIIGGKNTSDAIDTIVSPLKTALNAQTPPPIVAGIVTVTPAAGNANPFGFLDVAGNLLGISTNFGALEKSKGIQIYQYPIDAIYYNPENKDILNAGGKEQQDHLSISKYLYKPPNQEQLFQKTTNAGETFVQILNYGLTRGTPLSDYLGTVLLPMPNNVSDSNNVAWGEDNMNNLSAAAANLILSNIPSTIGAGAAGSGIGALIAGIIANLTKGNVAGSAAQGAQAGAGLGIQAQILSELLINSTEKEAKAIIGTSLASKVLSMGGFSITPESILSRGAGIVPNSNLELLFNAPTLREFTFQYRLSPRDEPEAKVINKIIRFFKEGMAVKKLNSSTAAGAGANSYFLGTPDVFKLNYRTTNNQNIKGVNRIKICALTGFSVNYTADGAWSSYDKGQPVSSIINMSFKELEPIYDSDYQKKIFDGRDDLESVNDDEVGY